MPAGDHIFRGILPARVEGLCGREGYGDEERPASGYVRRTSVTYRRHTPSTHTPYLHLAMVHNDTRSYVMSFGEISRSCVDLRDLRQLLRACLCLSFSSELQTPTSELKKKSTFLQ